MNKGDADDRLHVAGGNLACGPGMVAVRPRLTGEVPTVPSETVLFAGTAAVARQLNAYPAPARRSGIGEDRVGAVRGGAGG